MTATSASAWMSVGGKADVEWCCEESPLMTQSGHPDPLGFVSGVLGAADTTTGRVEATI
jgi:hypothetical protein